MATTPAAQHRPEARARSIAKDHGMLRVYLFGSPRLERDGAALALRRRKGLGLLAYLAVTGQTHSRDALLTLLWPDFDEADARNNLRRELSLLRAMLGDELLVADRHQVAWSPAAGAWVDVIAFGQQLAAARQHQHAETLCAACAAALTEAVTLAGDAFLAGYSLAASPVFDEWLFFQREELHQQLALALESLVGWHEGRGELPEALVFARRWLALDALHEPPRRALMRLYARAGQHAAALRQYEEGARLLADEIGAAPEQATIALFEAIKRRQLGAAPVQPEPPAPEPAPPASPLPTPTAAAAERALAPADEVTLPLTSFVGREHEIATLLAQLAEPGCRLLTLVGPGGIGKTRLASEVAARTARAGSAVGVVGLSGADEPAHVPAAIAAALGLQLTGAGDGWTSLEELLRRERLLLVLDNMEQLLDAAPRLARLLHAAPGLKLLVTAREPLKLQEEWLFPVEGLRMPEASAAGVENAAEAEQLFAARAQQARRGFSLADEHAEVTRICRMVGGMPLAIELAAAWTATLSCAAIADEITRGLAILETDMRNVPARHRSIQAVFDQTWTRLEPAHQRALARLAVFAGSFTREAAAAVAGADAPTLARLLGHGLVGRAGDRRYQLHPLVRSYAARRLHGSDDEPAVHAAYGRFYGGFLCEQFANQLNGAQLAGINAVGLERENIRAALPAALAQTDGEPVRQMALILVDFYFTRGLYQEGREQLALIERRLRSAGEAPEARWVLAHVLTGQGMFAVRQGQIAEANARFHEGVAILAALERPPGPGDATDPEIGLGLVALIQGDYRAASRYAERVRARSAAHGLATNLAYAWYLLAEAAQAQGLLPAAHAAAARALHLATAAGAEWFSAYVRNQLGQIAAARGRFAEADGHFRAGYATREPYGDYEGMAVALLNQGDAAAQQGQHEAARLLYERSLALYRHVIDRGATARALLGLGSTARALGALAQAWEQLGQALRLAHSLSYHHVTLASITQLAAVLIDVGRAAEAPLPLTVALLHPASRSDTTRQAQLLLARCEELLPAELFAGAVARGRQAELDMLVEQLLGETGPLAPSPAAG